MQMMVVEMEGVRAGADHVVVAGKDNLTVALLCFGYAKLTGMMM
jgi:hypothetical protein